MSFEDRLNDELEPLPDEDTFADVREFLYTLEEDPKEIINDILADLEEVDVTGFMEKLSYNELILINADIKSKISAVIHFAKQEPGKTIAIKLEHFPYHVTATQTIINNVDTMKVTLEEIR